MGIKHESCIETIKYTHIPLIHVSKKIKLKFYDGYATLICMNIFRNGYSALYSYLYKDEKDIFLSKNYPNNNYPVRVL